MSELLTVEQLRALIRDRLDVIVPRDAIYLELHRAGTGRGARVTAGMPPPVDKVARELRFDHGQVEQWLVDHPQLRARRAEAALAEAIAATRAMTPGEEERAWFAAVQEARANGLPLARIAEIISESLDRQVSRQAVHARLGRLLSRHREGDGAQP